MAAASTTETTTTKTGERFTRGFVYRVPRVTSVPHTWYYVAVPIARQRQIINFGITSDGVDVLLCHNVSSNETTMMVNSCRDDFEINAEHGCARRVNQTEYIAVLHVCMTLKSTKSECTFHVKGCEAPTPFSPSDVKDYPDGECVSKVKAQTPDAAK